MEREQVLFLCLAGRVEYSPRKSRNRLFLPPSSPRLSFFKVYDRVTSLFYGSVCVNAGCSRVTRGVYFCLHVQRKHHGSTPDILLLAAVPAAAADAVRSTSTAIVPATSIARD